MAHFLEITDLSSLQIKQLMKRALFFKHHNQFPDYDSFTAAMLFYENSTRTRVSFELAAKRLGMGVIHLGMETSSEAKGETILDTVRNLAAMGIQFFVVRHEEAYLPHRLAQSFKNRGVHILNAGDGSHAHPSQALLDILTIVEQKGEPGSLRIAIVGDIRHSRVANSLQMVFQKMSVKHLSLVAPKVWQPQEVHFGETTDSIETGLANADVVICLRVQQERIQATEQLDLKTYASQYCLTEQTLKFAKPDAIVMHPGPVNRGIEIEDAVADGPQSVILEQVRNGVFMRMAIFEAMAMGF